MRVLTIHRVLEPKDEPNRLNGVVFCDAIGATHDESMPASVSGCDPARHYPLFFEEDGIEGFVWCDKYGAVHADTTKPYGDAMGPDCDVRDHRPLYVKDGTGKPVVPRKTE